MTGICSGDGEWKGFVTVFLLSLSVTQSEIQSERQDNSSATDAGRMDERSRLIGQLQLIQKRPYSAICMGVLRYAAEAAEDDE
ncbi:TPA: hypothetical protein I8Y34_001421 [Raoultella ornithinolytica]|nr:hypothetical protein [Raoultella ornithinolytica]